MAGVALRQGGHGGVPHFGWRVACALVIMYVGKRRVKPYMRYNCTPLDAMPCCAFVPRRCAVLAVLWPWSAEHVERPERITQVHWQLSEDGLLQRSWHLVPREVGGRVGDRKGRGREAAGTWSQGRSGVRA